MDTRSRLAEVSQRGAPAQRDRARGLLQRLEADPADAQALQDADALVDAYLHDPYLIKQEPPQQGGG